MWAQEGHNGCASTGTDACVSGTVGARARHVIDSRGKCIVRIASCHSLSIRR